MQNMSYEHPIETIENETLIVGVLNDENHYLLWQLELSGSDEVYFEYDDQGNSGYNWTERCVIKNKTIEVLLNTGANVKFKLPMSFDKHSELRTRLEKIYKKQEHQIVYGI